ncbi:MAG: hypothetical protein JXB33_10745 [Clostridia bacterium]|nr:hypothetical protein [Clostridia bacterium]
MKKAAFVFLIAAVIFSMFWFFYPFRSILVMSVYSAIHRQDSIMTQEGFSLEIPGGAATPGRDWFVMPMTYNAGDFKGRPGIGTDMSIIYNFPAFNPLTRTNSFYETDSGYCSAFYGAYVLRTDDKTPYGFTPSGNPDIDEILAAFKYDYTVLVLESLGCTDAVFEVIDYDMEPADYLGYDGWTKLDARIHTNSVSHSYVGSRRSYLQYGRPLNDPPEDFPKIEINGRLYIRYFPELGSTVAMYVMAPDRILLEDCDSKLLGKSVLKIKR